MGRQKKTIATTQQIRISENAIRNIDEITGYIAYINYQPLIAIKVGDQIFGKKESIEQNPYAFKECRLVPTKAKMYRQALYLSWYIIYKIDVTKIIVLGVTHGSRRPSKIKRLRKIK